MSDQFANDGQPTKNTRQISDTQIGIGRYLTMQAVMIVVVISFISAFTIKTAYQWGTYDTSHYFMSLAAEDMAASEGWYAEHYVEVIHDWEKIPNVGSDLTEAPQDMIIKEMDHDVLYVLPFLDPTTGKQAYAVHRYQGLEDDYETDLELIDLQVLLGIGTLLVVATLLAGFFYSIAKPIRLLGQWVSVVATSSTSVTLDRNKLKFEELGQVADQFEKAITTIEQKTKEEKQYLKALSHELRTPLAITKASLDLLEKFPDKLVKEQNNKLIKLRRANNNMLSTTECLLWLWADKERAVTTERVEVKRAVEQVIERYDYILQRKSVSIDLNIVSKLELDMERGFFDIVLGNLIRNSFQYTDDGTISIMADEGSFRVTNPIDMTVKQGESTDYGYGIGLFLVEKLCQHKGWLLEINANKNSYSVSIQHEDREVG